MEVSGQLHAPTALALGKNPPGTHWIAGWGPGPVWTLGSIDITTANAAAADDNNNSNSNNNNNNNNNQKVF
jgi:hypothetical protein